MKPECDFFICRLLLKLALCLVFGSLQAADHSTVTPFPKPRVAIDLAKLGWKASPPESDKSFFRTYSIEKLEAMDMGTRVAFLNDDLFVAYHTITEHPEGKDWRALHRELEAFFINSKDGTLLLKKRWVTRSRKDNRDDWDSEARLIRVSNDRFLVHADGVLMLYSTNFDLLKEKTLEPAGLGDLWAVQSVPGGRYVFLRHGTRSRMYAKYSWLAADTLESKYQMESYDLWSVVATDDYMIGGSDAGVQMIGLDKHAETICADAPCREAGLTILSRHSVAFSGRRGIGVIDTSQGLLWSDDIPLQYVPQFGQVKSATSGRKFAVDVYTGGRGKAFFHGVKVKGVDTMFVYDADSKIPLYAFRLGVAYPYALSPDGTQIAVLSTGILKIYSTN
jgi:hypothetical protein